jgi:arylsulfatase
VRLFLPFLVGLTVSFAFRSSASAAPPNFVVILLDDVGYSDIGCFGSKVNRTPRLDQLANEGLRLTSFYAQTVCGPSRAALLTGRYPTRVGGGWRTESSEITIAEVLKTVGYATCCIGKWDISQRRSQPGLIPNDQGFDEYFGPLGANDNGAVTLFRNRDEIQTTRDMASLTKSYTDEAIDFITHHKDKPFFLYLPHTMAHVVIDASAQFKGKSNNELYGDVIEELDWNIGRLIDALKTQGVADNTIVVFTTDNGPWSGPEARYRKSHGDKLATGTAKPLRSGKGSAYEGGFRVPTIVWGPKLIPAGRENDAISSTLDLLPTIATLAGAKAPTDRPLDGFDQSALFTGKSTTSSRDRFFYHVKEELHAVRQGDWKLMIPNRMRFFAYTGDAKVTTPELYNLREDIGETKNVADKHPEIVQRLTAMIAEVPARSGPEEPERDVPRPMTNKK